MVGSVADYDFGEAIAYHSGQFPPSALEHEKIVRPLSRAASAIARYDAKLATLHNSELLLAPLRNSEAVVSSRMEGTVATLDEVLQIQADADDDEDTTEDRVQYRNEALEVFSYTRAMKQAQRMISDGLPICSRLIRETHSRLLFFGRGADKAPGQFKKDQNYVVDQRQRKVLFIPEEHQNLEDGIASLERYINDPEIDPLIQTAVMHVEFEALHPFKDGNGRLGRMLIPLNLWQKGQIHAPHFYVSGALEQRRGEYLDRLRAVSANGDWTGWIVFFLEALEAQARENTVITEKIGALYEEMKERFRVELSSKWAHLALDYVFARPVFRNSSFTASAGIPIQTAHRFSRVLTDAGILTVATPASGRRAALLTFRPLMEIVRV